MSPKTPQQNRKIRERSRQQIMDAAFELFARNGYSRTSIAAVAEKAGISKGLIYHYFDSKQAILEGIFDRLIQFGDELLDFPDDYTAADKIRHTLEGTFRFIEEQKEVGRLMIALALQPETAASLKPKIDKVNKTQTVVYANLLKELGYDQPELEAYRLGALMDGLLLGYITMGDDYPFDKVKTKIMHEYVPSENN